VGSIHTLENIDGSLNPLTDEKLGAQQDHSADSAKLKFFLTEDAAASRKDSSQKCVPVTVHQTASSSSRETLTSQEVDIGLPGSQSREEAYSQVKETLSPKESPDSS